MAEAVAAERSKLLQWIELISLFIGIPGAIVIFIKLETGVRAPFIPILLFVLIFCFVLLLRDRNFSRRLFWQESAQWGELKRILPIWCVFAGSLIGLIWLLKPEILFQLPREKPALWAVIMVAYPILSVYPQGLIYRVFFFHRYREVFKHPAAMIFMAAFLFGFMHIIFLNPVAPVLTFIGGLLFSWTYHRTQSAILASVEHAIYGQLMFTVGLGSYFYGGTAQFAGG